MRFSVLYGEENPILKRSLAPTKCIGIKCKSGVDMGAIFPVYSTRARKSTEMALIFRLLFTKPSDLLQIGEKGGKSTPFQSFPCTNLPRNLAQFLRR